MTSEKDKIQLLVAIKRAVEQEREACAQIADRIVQPSEVPLTFQSQVSHFTSECAKAIAAAIRARGM